MLGGSGVELLEGEGGGVAGGEDPGDGGVEALGEFVGEDEADVVTAVVFGGEGFTVVERLAGAVEETVGVAPGVAEPAGEAAKVFLGEELDAIGPATAHADFVFPALRAAPEGGSVFVFEQVVHAFVVALDGEVERVEEVVEEAGGHLVGVHGRDVGGDGDPEVGGQGDGGGAEEVEVLGHVGVAHFGREAVVDEVAAAEAGLEGGVELALDSEAGEVEAEVDFEAVVDAPVVFGIGADFVGGDAALADGGVDGCGFVFDFFHAEGLGGEVVEDVVGAEFDGVVGGGGVVEVGTGEEVAYAGVEVEGVAIVVVAELVDIFLGDGEVAAVAGECTTEVHEELGGELVVPAKAAHDVAPAVAEAGILGVVVAVDELEAGVDNIVAHVVRSVEAAAVAEAVGDLGVEIIEIRTGIDTGGAAFGQAFHAGGHGEDGLDEDVAVGAAGGDGEGGLFFDDGAFEVGFGGDEADADAAVELFVVAVVGGDVEDGGESAAETGREAAFVELDVLDGVGVEGGEEAAEVVDVVHRHAVEEEEVLVGATATDVHAGHALAAVLDTGQELDGFDHVGLAKEHGDGFDLLDGDFDHAGL